MPICPNLLALVGSMVFTWCYSRYTLNPHFAAPRGFGPMLGHMEL